MAKKKLLVADDEPMSREVITRNFRDLYDVYEAANGKEALEIIHSMQIDIVILDLVMPEINGYEVLQQIKCDEKYSDLRVLVATSIMEKTERKALELGADDIVFKPYDPVVIKKRMDNLLIMQDQKRELEHALEQSERSNKAKTEFLSRVSHDMRTPLNGILGITTLMKDKVTDTEIFKDLLQLEMSGKYLLNLINDTLDVNKIEVGKMELHPDVFDGRSAANHIFDLIKPSLEGKNIHFSVDADNLPYTTLYIDMGRLEQVIMNILSNAVKFTPNGGHINVQMTNLYHDDKVIRDRLVISDDGMGMSKEFLPHLFEPFSQENPGNTGNTTGTGLGMTITKQIIELMGGTIQVESDLGKGTTFTIELPMNIASSKQIEDWNSKQKIDINNLSFAGKRVLLCEDHPLNTEITTRLLERRGVFVEHADNGKTGLSMYEKSSEYYYDLILMDIRMPVMDGLECARKIRMLPRKDAKKIPIIAMTANTFNNDIVQVKKAGMDAHLAKPVDVENMFECMAKLMNIEHHVIRKQILVVDDIEMNRKVIKATLDMDYDVYEAGSGYEALEILSKQNGISIVITDIQMPGMNGCELVKKIRSNPDYNRISIIANTQFGDPEQEEELLKLGANDFVYKPTTPKIVELRVRNVLNRL